MNCSVCSGPLVPCPDLPDAHPGCAPVDAARWEAETGGPRSYTGRSRPAVHEAGCRGCGGRIAPGESLNLADLPDGRAWVHAACDPEQSDATTPLGALSATESAATTLPRAPGTPAGRRERSGDDTTAPRRAA